MELSRPTRWADGDQGDRPPALVRPIAILPSQAARRSLGGVGWQYGVWTLNDDIGAVVNHLAEKSAEGWELVSASAVSWPEIFGFAAGQQTWHVQYVHYWRRWVE